MELTEMIIGAAMAVHRAMGPGLDEKIYENSMCIELAELGIAFSQQDQFPAFYKNHFVGKLITDLIVANKIILELKVADSISETHIAQALSYLTITKTPNRVGFQFQECFPSIQASCHQHFSKHNDQRLCSTSHATPK